MVVHCETVEIAAPADEVWRVLADVVGWPTWTPSMRRVESLQEPGLAVGARYRVRQPRLPPVVWTVDGLVPGASFSWTSGSPGIRSRGDHRLEPAPTGTRVVLTFEQSGPLAGVSGLVYGRLVRRYVHLEADGLRRHVERRGHP